MTDRNHVVVADLWSDGNVAGKVEVHWQGDEFVKRHQVVWCNKWNVHHEDENFLVRFVHVRSFHQKKIGRLVDKRK